VTDKKAIKFTGEIRKYAKNEILKAIELSKGTGKECGFVVCSNGKVQPAVCGESDHVSFPSCSTKTKFEFHTHPSSLSPSAIDIISGLGIGAEKGCIANKKGEISCFDYEELKERNRELAERVAKQYNVVMQRNPSPYEAIRELKPLIREVREKLMPVNFRKLFI